jgi:hypothetical protein
MVRKAKKNRKIVRKASPARDGNIGSINKNQKSQSPVGDVTLVVDKNSQTTQKGRNVAYLRHF